jgi:hypothetical protein
MAKRRLKIEFRIPSYASPRNEWRKLIHKSAQTACEKNKVGYSKDDLLEVHAIFYLKNPALRFHDLDNRLKDVMDALQGRLGGQKNIRNYPPIIPNDSQIFKVSAIKMLPPKQSHNFGHVKIIGFKK